MQCTGNSGCFTSAGKASSHSTVLPTSTTPPPPLNPSLHHPSLCSGSVLEASFAHEVKTTVTGFPAEDNQLAGPSSYQNTRATTNHSMT